jgi:hypothetical protein
MSFITDAFNWITGGSIGAKLARTALTGFALNKVTASINRDNEATRLAESPVLQESIDLGTRVGINPNTDASIPILYGTAYTGGIITDAYLSSDNLTMTVVYTISEKTGPTVFSTGADQYNTFVGVDVNDNFIRFENDGVSVKEALAPSGQLYNNLAGLVEIHLYDGDSETPRAPRGYDIDESSLPPAYDVVDAWDSTYMMQDLVFAVCKVTYNADKQLRGLPDFKFGIINNIYKVGDVMLDYMTNETYGAGIPLAEIYTT